MNGIARALVVAALSLGGVASAHHSFAVFFVSDKMITIEGVVSEFVFRNPHGVIQMEVKTPDGKTETWRAETNSPSILERRGWKRDSLKAGDAIKVEGWPARDGSNYMRMRSVVRADGTPVGVPFESGDQK
jgi:hypothetical protein